MIYSHEKDKHFNPINLILNDINYVIWAQEIFSFLNGKKLWWYIIGDIPQPLKSEDKEISNYIVMLEE